MFTTPRNVIPRAWRETGSRARRFKRRRRAPVVSALEDRALLSGTGGMPTTPPVVGPQQAIHQRALHPAAIEAGAINRAERQAALAGSSIVNFPGGFVNDGPSRTLVNFPGGSVNARPRRAQVRFPGGFVNGHPRRTLVNFPGGFVNSRPGRTLVNFPGGFVNSTPNGTIVQFPGGSFTIG